MTITKNADGKYAGTWSAQWGESTLSDITADAGKVKFTQTSNFGGQDMKTSYEGTLEGGKLKGTAKGQWGEFTFEGTRGETKRQGAGQEPNPAPQKSIVKPSDLCSVEGVVVKSTTGEGIKRVTVQLFPSAQANQPYSTLTENNGYFIIRDIAPGRYVINASGNGYTQQASGKGKGNTQVSILDLTPGKNVSGIAFRLVPPGVIAGTVYDEDGDPVTLAQVKALRVAGSGAHRQVSEGGSGQTNDLGEYRIWGLQPGKYLVAATYQPPQTNPGQQTDEVYLPTFHPSTPDTSQATLG